MIGDLRCQLQSHVLYTCFFTRKIRLDNVQLKLYGQTMERLTEFKYLGLWFHEKYMWRNVKLVETKLFFFFFKKTELDRKI